MPPGAIRAAVADGKLSPTAAFEATKLGDPAARDRLAARAVGEGMSRAEVAGEVRRTSTRPRKAATAGNGRGRTSSPRGTSATIKTASGWKLTPEPKRGVDPAGMLAALIEAAEQLRPLAQPPAADAARPASSSGQPPRADPASGGIGGSGGTHRGRALDRPTYARRIGRAGRAAPIG